MSTIYNRYIPCPDGSYRVTVVEDSSAADNTQVPSVQSSKESGFSLPSLLGQNFDAGDFLLLAVFFLLLLDGQEEDRTSVLLAMAAFILS